MRTLTSKLFCMAAAVTLTASLSSCEEEDMQTDYLCSRIWTDEWTDEYGTTIIRRFHSIPIILAKTMFTQKMQAQD